ncbi:MAG: DUF6167 family protein [Nocardioidaceae bacterium]
MSRMFWFAVGAGSGVYAVVRTRRAAERFTPSGVADQIGALGTGARLLCDDVLLGMGERESELRQRLGALDAGQGERLGVTHGGERGGR